MYQISPLSSYTNNTYNMMKPCHPASCNVSRKQICDAVAILFYPGVTSCQTGHSQYTHIYAIVAINSALFQDYCRINPPTPVANLNNCVSTPCLMQGVACLLKLILEQSLRLCSTMPSM
jgi:hypothetical protein